MLFETDRLACRRWVAQDVDALFAVYSDAETVRWCGDGGPLTKADCLEWLSVTQRNYAERGYGMFSFVSRETGRVVGFGGLVHPGGQADAEIKYAFDRACWGQGFASEIVPALLHYGATIHALQRVIATVAAENKASLRVLTKSGMSFESSRDEEDGSVTHTYSWRPAAAAPASESLPG